MCIRIQLLIVVFTLIANGVCGQKSGKSPLRKINHDISKIQSSRSSQEILEETINISSDNQLIAVGKRVDQQGYLHQKFQQFHNGVKVMGGIQTLHTYRDKKYKVTGAFISLDNAPTQSKITEQQARNTAISKYAGSQKRFTDLEGKPELIYYYHQGLEKVFLCYKVDLYIQDPISRMDIYVDAITGKVIETIEKIHTIDTDLNGIAKYEGEVSLKGEKINNQYRLRNQSHKIETYSLGGSTDYNDAEHIISSDQYIDEDPIAVQAHYGAEQTYSFFNERYGRNSYDDNGTSIKSYVHYSIDYANAFWDGLRMTYGDGNGTSIDALVSLDIVAHEISHGVTQYSADLLYKYEAGALNESFSDIFGEAVEQYSRGSNDWLMGSEIFINGGAVRSLSDPNLFSDPDTYMGDHFYIGGSDHGGVHTNSGVQNFWFYLLSEGGSGINDLGETYQVDSIGIEKAAAIAYRNLSTYLSTYSNFYDAREGAIQAAKDLYGDHSPEEIAVTNAWHAVGVGAPYHITRCYEGALTINIHFDNYPAETSWMVKDNSGTTIATGGPYSEQSPGDNVQEIIPLDNGNYEVILQDSYGDGLCCGYGDGNYEIFIGNQSIRKGAYFASEDVTSICIGDDPVTIDTIPPAQPLNLQSMDITTDGFTVLWDESTDTSGIEAYHITLDNSFYYSTGESSISFSGLNSGTTYEIGVSALDLYGNQSLEATIAVTTEEEQDNPPSSVEVEVSNIHTSGALLQWSASHDDGSVISYHIYLDNEWIQSENVLQLQLDNLTAETTYEVYVLAEDDAGQLSLPVITSFATLSQPDVTPPSIPGSLLADNITFESARVSWAHSQDESGLLNYDVYLGEIFIATIPDNQFNLNGLAELSTYTVKVRARDIHQNVSSFSQVQFTTLKAPDTQAPSIPTGLEVIEIDINSAKVVFDPSTDNEAVMGYNIYLEGEWIDFTQHTSYQLSGLIPDKDYSVGVVAIDESENASDQASTSFRTLSEYNPVEDLLLGSYFENGWDGWIDGGSDAYRYRGSYSPEGNYSIRLRDNSGSRSSMTTEYMDLSNYSTISIRFSYHPYSLETNEDFYVEYHDGFRWNTLARFISGTHFINYNTYAAEIIMSSGDFAFSSAGSFRIRCDASSNADRVYIDEVMIVGNPALGIRNTPSSVDSYLVREMNVDKLNESDMEILIYPNPFSDQLFIEAEEDIQRVNLYSIEGKLIKSQTEFDDFGMDVSNLGNGIYIIEIKSDDETHHQKLIKR